MTREEALKIYKDGFPLGKEAERAIDVLINLGILKVDPPKTATDRALDILNRHLTTSGRTLTSHTLCDLMNLANVRIVDKS
jgi:hypothetical protein